MPRLKSKVAFITGGARGQGRSHAVRFAQEGADVIVVDLCDSIGSLSLYPPSTREDLAQTVKLVEGLDRRIVALTADVRDRRALQKALDQGIAELGRLDVVVANAGICDLGPLDEVSDESWRDIIDINLTGVWNTVKVASPHLVNANRGGSIIITSSTCGIKGPANSAPYTASKHGVVGLMKTLANELGPHRIRVNTVHPTSCNTDMIQNEGTYRLFLPESPHPTQEEVAPSFQASHVLPTPWIEPIDVSNAILFLASDEARFITGAQLTIDAGFVIK